MIKIIFKELAIYIVLFIALAAAMHPDLFSAPMERLTLMTERQNYIHPFVYTLLAYLIICMFRLFFKTLASLLKMQKKR